VAAASKGLKKRTPNSFAPKTAVLARMAKAIPGPLLKVGGRQSLRPHPVMRFVKGEICRCQK
jgi:hypothetical protein